MEKLEFGNIKQIQQSRSDSQLQEILGHMQALSGLLSNPSSPHSAGFNADGLLISEGWYGELEEHVDDILYKYQ